MCKICCNICCKNKEKKNIIVCISCNIEICNLCFQRYFEQQESINKNCMNCKLQFHPSYLKSILPISFIKNNFEKVLFKEEELLLPHTQKEANIILKINNLTIQINSAIVDSNTLNKKIKTYDKLSKNINYTLIHIKDKSELIELTDIKNKISRLSNRKETYDKYTELLYNLNLITNERSKLINIKKKKTYAIQFKCTNIDCNGYIDDDMTCSQCDKVHCDQCQEIITKNHTCKKETIENIEYLKNNAKNCPKCWTNILKTDGCDHMYCTNCETSFSWKTGQIIKGYIINPEYFKNLRDKGLPIPRNPDDINCFTTPLKYYEAFVVFKYKTIALNLDYELYHELITIYNKIIQKISMLEMQNDTNLNIKKNLRIKYINELITERNFKNNLFKLYMIEKNKESIHDVLITYRETLNYILYKMIIVSNSIKIGDIFNEYIKSSYDNLDIIVKFIKEEYNKNICNIEKDSFIKMNIIKFLI